MNKRQKAVQQAFINDEKKILKDLKNIYNQALQDITTKSQELQNQINNFQELINNTDDEKELERLKSMHQSKVYQKQYQDALKKQVGSILDNMQVEEFKSVSEYLNKCYEQGFVGTMFDLQGQGIPLCFPIDQQAMVQAVQLDSKISDGLYSRIGENVAELKKTITAEVTRGIANGSNFSQIAQQIKARMVGTYDNKTGGALYRAELIARTEGHRIQVQSAMNACYDAKDRGADVVKQWDSTLDGDTRPSHRQVDGEIKELDEKFSNGLMFPGDPSGGASEVCNCRCALLQRARWTLNDDFTKMDNKNSELIKIKATDYDEFKKQYWSEVKKNEIQNFDITEGGKYAYLTISDKNKYADYIEHEFTTQKLAVKELKQMWDKSVGYIQNSQGYQDINSFMRNLKPKLDNLNRRFTIKIMERVTNNNVLTKDYIGIRKVDSGYLVNVLGLDVDGLLKTSLQKNAFGRKMPVQIPKDKKAAQTIADKINGLIGTDKGTISDGAFTSVSLSEGLNYFTHFPFKFEIQMPLGTKGLITDNLPESEFITKNNSALEIIGATVYNDGEKDCVKIFARLLQ